MLELRRSKAPALTLEVRHSKRRPGLTYCSMAKLITSINSSSRAMTGNQELPCFHVAFARFRSSVHSAAAVSWNAAGQPGSWQKGRNRMMRKSVAIWMGVAFTALVPLGCTEPASTLPPENVGESESPIINGYIDDGHPSVGLIYPSGCTA